MADEDDDAAAEDAAVVEDGPPRGVRAAAVVVVGGNDCARDRNSDVRSIFSGSWSIRGVALVRLLIALLQDTALRKVVYGSKEVRVGSFSIVATHAGARSAEEAKQQEAGRLGNSRQTGARQSGVGCVIGKVGSWSRSDERVSWFLIKNTSYFVSHVLNN